MAVALVAVGGAYYLNAQDGCSAASQNAYGLSIAYRSPQQLYNDSDAVIVGTVERSSVLCIDTSGSPVIQTTAKIRVEEYLKSSLELDFVIIKDNFSLARSQYESPPSYMPGERMLLFLNADNGEDMERGEFSYAIGRTLAANQTGLSVIQGIGSKLEPNIVHLAPNNTATAALHVKSFFGFFGPLEITKGQIEIQYPSSTGDLKELEARDDRARTMKLENWITPVFADRVIGISFNRTISVPVSIVVSEDAKPGLYLLPIFVKTEQAPAEGHLNELQLFVNVTDAGAASHNNASMTDFSMLDDVNNNGIKKVVDVQDDPAGIAVNPVTNMIYVANRDSDSVSVIDGSTDDVIDSIAVGSKPVAVAVNPNTNVIYVANSGSDTISIIDGTSNAVIRQVPVGDYPVSIALNIADNNTAYVANAYSGNITVINGSKYNAERSIGADRFITDVAINSDTDWIYYVNLLTHSLARMPDCLEWCGIDVAGTGADPRSMVIDPVSNKTYVATSGEGLLSIIDISSLPMSSAGSIAGVDGRELAHDAKRNLLYATNPNYGSLTVIDTMTSKVVDRIKVGGNGTSSIAINPKTGMIYVTNYFSDSVSILAPYIPERGDDSTVTVTGQVVCLPHRKVFAPFPGLSETAECGIGFQSIDGKYYGLGLDEKHQWLSAAWNPDKEELFNVTGVLTLGPDINEYSSRYDVVGILNATSVTTLDGRVSIYEVYDRHYDQLQAIVKQIQDRAGGGYSMGVGECDGEPCIRIALDNDVQELSAKIPRQLEGFRVSVEIAG